MVPPMDKNLLLLASVFFFVTGNGQSAADAAVQITASVQVNPAQITLNWVANTTTSQYQIHRKLKTAVSWGSALATLSGSVNQYIDSSISDSTSYEYRILRSG